MPFPKFSKITSQNPEETDKFLQDEGDVEGTKFIRARWQTNSSRYTIFLISAANIFIFIISLACASFAYRSWNMLRHNHNNAILRETDWYSPVYDQVQINFIEKKINGTLLSKDHELLRAAPSPEVDAAWDRIGSLAPHVITTEDVIRLGKDPAKTARWGADWGFGDDAHMAELDTLHTIHCLNAIRRDVHWKYYFADMYPDGNLPELHRVHTNHCIYVVLQNLMCSATADMVTMPWVEGQLHPFPDFSINKKCRDFEALMDWHERNKIDDTARLAKMRMPEGHEPYPMSDEFHRVFATAQDDDHHH